MGSNFLVAALMGGLMQICQSMVGRVLLALGMGFVTYQGFDLSIQWLLTTIKSNFAGLPISIASFLAWIWVDKAISMMFSAFAVSMMVRTVQNGSFTKLVQKGS